MDRVSEPNWDILREGNWEELTEYLADAAEYRKGFVKGWRN